MQNPKLTKLCVPIEIDSRKQEIVNNLNTLSSAIIQRDELIAEYVSLIAESHKERHGVHPPAGGHQPKNKFIAEAARELTMLGRTEGARRQLIARALRVASICPEAKTAAVEAGLGNQQETPSEAPAPQRRARRSAAPSAQPG
jgi:hypothetical protein